MHKNYNTKFKNMIIINMLIVIAIIALVFAIFLNVNSDKSLIQDALAKNEIESNVIDMEKNDISAAIEKTEGENINIEETKNSDNVEKKEDDTKKETDIKNIIDNMSLEQKVAQLFIITPESLTDNVDVAEAGEATKVALSQYPIGGIIYFEGNINAPNQVLTMIENTKNYNREFSDIPMFFCVDEEGGRICRIANNPNFDVTRFPDMIDVGNSGDTSAAYNVGNGIGSYLKELGFNVDFAPVADVLSNPENTIVQTRSFGSDAYLVSAMVEQVSRGLNDNGIITSPKHFPGHGATVGDTHQGYSYTDKTLDELMQNELIPFKDAINKGADMIMIGHISIPAITGDDVPSSLSGKVIKDILRAQLGFGGVVITDALNMTAVTTQYDSAQVAIMTIKAGADLILMPSDFHSAYEGMLEAVRNQTISEERLNDSLERILKLKFKYL